MIFYVNLQANCRLSLTMIVLKFTEKPCDIRIGGENFENYQAKRQGGRF